MIKCSKCNAELSDDTKFCSYCGTKIETPPSGANEKSNTNASDDESINVNTLNSNTSKSIGDKIKSKIAEGWKKLTLYGKTTTIAAVLFVLLALIGWGTGKTIAGIIAVLQIALLIVSILIHKNIIKLAQKLQWLKYIVLATAILLTILNIKSYSWGENNKSKNSTTSQSQISDIVSTTKEPVTTIDETSKSDESDNQHSSTDYTIDYVDAASFEKALNDGAKVKDKIVQFDVIEYKPDSALGINCWSGEHLNFISKEELDVEKGDIIVGYITDEPTETLGSWTIHYEVLSIGGEKVKEKPAETTVSESPSDVQSSKITVTMNEEDFIGMLYTDAEAKLRKMGFTVFEYETLETEDVNNPDDTIGAVEIKSWEYGKGDFEVGDIYETDAIVVLWYYVCDEPKPNLTVDNCSELAALLELSDPSDPSVSAFANSYSGQVIEFDGCVTAMQNHEDYTTRWDVLLGAGDFDENSMRGPNFRLTDVNYYDMNVSGGDSIYVGLNVHVVAEVGDYNSNTTLFELEIISMEIRN